MCAYLVERGDADPDRLCIRGGSAGGFTTLAALTFHDVFAAGASHYGVADLGVLAADTHKFESRYLDGLVGPWPEARATYEERSPIFHTDRIDRPLAVFQGLDDPIVPPNQAEMIVEALRAKGVPSRTWRSRVSSTASDRPRTSAPPSTASSASTPRSWASASPRPRASSRSRSTTSDTVVSRPFRG